MQVFVAVHARNRLLLREGSDSEGAKVEGYVVGCENGTQPRESFFRSKNESPLRVERQETRCHIERAIGEKVHALIHGGDAHVVDAVQVGQEGVGYLGLRDGSRDDGHTHEKKEE